MKNLVAKFRNLLKNVDTSYVRDIHRSIPWDDRLIAILGARGVGMPVILIFHIPTIVPLLCSRSICGKAINGNRLQQTERPWHDQRRDV